MCEEGPGRASSRHKAQSLRVGKSLSVLKYQVGNLCPCGAVIKRGCGK